MSVRETVTQLTGIEIGATPHREIFRRGNLRLLEYQAAEGLRTSGTPIVVIPSLINRHYVLDLLPGASFIEAMCLAGFRVFSIEWIQPHSSDRHLSIDDLFELRIDKALARAAARSKTGTIHLVGQCLGGTLALIESLLRPERIETLTLMTTPIDFASAGQLGSWAQAPLDVTALTDAYGNIPSSLLQSSFKWLRPSLALAKLSRVAERWRDDDFMKAFFALEVWAADNVDFPAECYRFLIESLYRENKLTRGEITIGARNVDLSKLSVPIFEALAADDYIVPSSMRLPELSLDITRREYRGGHLGAVIGGSARKTFWPELIRWLKSHELQIAAH